MSQTLNPAHSAAPAQSRRMTKRLRPAETIMRIVLLTCGVVSVATTIGIVLVLGLESLAFFREVPVTDFLFGTTWQPRLGQFGVWPLLTATLTTTIFALFVAVPLGLAAAIYLSEYAPARTRATLKPVLELLAGIPTVVYGYFALTFMTPLLQTVFGPQVQVYNTLSAGLVMGIMILPTVASMSEDALNPFEPAQTITGYIASISGGDISYDSLDYMSIFALGLFLFVFTLILNLISQWISRRFREVYQ